jgi:hypothetical protein
MPELAMMYFIGAISCLGAAFIALFREYRKKQTPAYQTLQANLAKVGLYWSDASDRLVLARDQKPFGLYKSLVILGFFCAALSWLGLLFFLVLYFSVKKLSGRQKKNLFASGLAQGTLDEADVRKRLQDQGLFP